MISQLLTKVAQVFDFVSPVCPHCGKHNAIRGRFCDGCAQPMRGSVRKCPSCGAWLQAAGGNNCRKCGAAFSGKLRIPGIRWERGMQTVQVSDGAGGWIAQEALEVSRSFDQVDLVGALSGGVFVELGSQATVLLDGRPSSTLPPGFYDLHSAELTPLLAAGKPKLATVVLTDAGEISLGYTFPEYSAEQPDGFTSSDQVPVAAKVGINIRIADPVRFIENVVHGPKTEVAKFTPPGKPVGEGEPDRAPRLDAPVARGEVYYTTVDLQTRLASPLMDAARSALRSIPVADMFTAAGVRDRIESGIRSVMTPVLKQGGFELVSLGLFVPVSPALQSRLQAQGEGRVAEFDLQNSQERVKLLQRMQVIEWDKVKSEQEFEDQLADLRSEAEKAGARRTNSLAMESSRLDSTLELLRQEARQAVAGAQVNWERAQARLQLEFELENKRIDLITNLHISGHALDEQIRQERVRLEGVLASRLAEARSNAEIAKVALDVRKAEDEHGLNLAQTIQARELQRTREMAAIVADQVAKGVPEHIVLASLAQESPEMIPMLREVLASNRELMEAKAAARAAEGKAEGLREGIAAAAGVVGKMQNVNVTQLPSGR